MLIQFVPKKGTPFNPPTFVLSLELRFFLKISNVSLTERFGSSQFFKPYFIRIDLLVIFLFLLLALLRFLVSVNLSSFYAYRKLSIESGTKLWFQTPSLGNSLHLWLFLWLSFLSFSGSCFRLLSFVLEICKQWLPLSLTLYLSFMTYINLPIYSYADDSRLHRSLHFDISLTLMARAKGSSLKQLSSDLSWISNCCMSPRLFSLLSETHPTVFQLHVVFHPTLTSSKTPNSTLYLSFISWCFFLLTLTENKYFLSKQLLGA